MYPRIGQTDLARAIDAARTHSPLGCLAIAELSRAAPAAIELVDCAVNVLAADAPLPRGAGLDLRDAEGRYVHFDHELLHLASFLEAAAAAELRAGQAQSAPQQLARVLHRELHRRSVEAAAPPRARRARARRHGAGEAGAVPCDRGNPAAPGTGPGPGPRPAKMSRQRAVSTCTGPVRACCVRTTPTSRRPSRLKSPVRNPGLAATMRRPMAPPG